MNCIYCGKEVKGNIRKDCDVICGHCAMRLVGRIRKLEEESGIEIKNSEDMRKAEEIIEQKEMNYTGKDLREARKKKSLSQASLAFLLLTTPAYISQMESGAKPLNLKAIEFIKKQKIKKKKISKGFTTQGANLVNSKQLKINKLQKQELLHLQEELQNLKSGGKHGK